MGPHSGNRHLRLRMRIKMRVVPRVHRLVGSILGGIGDGKFVHVGGTGEMLLVGHWIGMPLRWREGLWCVRAHGIRHRGCFGHHTWR